MTMLFLLLVIIKSAASLICYQCDSANVPSRLVRPGEIELPFVVTKDNIPTLENCTEISVEESSHHCWLMVSWDFTETRTRIQSDLSRGDFSNEVIVQLTRIDENEPASVVGYFCSTDYCNDPSKLELLIKSNDFEIDRDQIVSLLTGHETSFNATQSCYKNINYTSPLRIFDVTCGVSNSSYASTSCTTLMMTNASTTEMCSGPTYWRSDYTFQIVTLYYIVNLTSSKEQYTYAICSNKTDCNGLDNIQEMSKFCIQKFDLTQFFGIVTTTSPSEVTTTVSIGNFLFPFARYFLLLLDFMLIIFIQK